MENIFDFGIEKGIPATTSVLFWPIFFFSFFTDLKNSVENRKIATTEAIFI